MATAKAAFSEIENATKVAKIDISIAAFLSPWRQTNGHVMTSFLDGEPLYELGPRGIVTKKLRTVQLDVPTAFEGIVNSVLVDGGEIEDIDRLDNENLYLMNSNAFFCLSQLLKLGYTNTGTERLIRDQAFASECANTMDEMPLNVIYREKDGVKKAFAMFANEKTWPTLDEIIEAMDEVSRKTGSDFRVEAWDITQKKRYVTFRDENQKRLTITLTDCEPRFPKVIRGTTKISVEDGDSLVNTTLRALAV